MTRSAAPPGRHEVLDAGIRHVELPLMREPPDLFPETVVGALHAQFGIQVAELVVLPIGDDSEFVGIAWSHPVDRPTS